MRHTFALLLLLTLAACGNGGGGGTPTAPAPTISSIVITLEDILLVGRNATATAVATLSNGQTQGVTSGWQSGATNIATVTNAGTVLGVSNGTAVISVSSGGRQASLPIRVAPDYEGQWQGFQVVTACRDTGELTGICEDPEVFPSVVGGAFPIQLSARQPGALEVSGEFVVEQIMFPTFITIVDDQGAMTFAAAAQEQELHASVRWSMTSPGRGLATGTIQETWTFPGLIQGEIVFESTLEEFHNQAVASQAVSTAPSLRRKLVERLRLQPRR
jgi:hypothetical protein